MQSILKCLIDYSQYKTIRFLFLSIRVSTKNGERLLYLRYWQSDI